MLLIGHDISRGYKRHLELHSRLPLRHVFENRASVFKLIGHISIFHLSDNRSGVNIYKNVINDVMI